MPEASPRWDEIEALFDRALKRPPAGRRAWLAEVCPDDAELRREVEEMAAAHERTHGVLEGRVDLPTGAEMPTERMPTVNRPDTGPRPDPAPEPAGGSVGPYRLLRQIGRGGMGVVYQAHDSRLDRDVALKFLHHRRAPPKVVARFLAEARAASALDHPNICTIHDVGEAGDGQLYIAMAYYEGENLADRIARGPLAHGDTVELAQQAAAGLARAHRAGIVHRDVKPANLFITEHAGPDRLKILDFGIAKLEDSHLTRSGTNPGTPAYMAPEQLRGEAVDGRTDIWSLGVVLFEMLTGQLPYKATAPGAILQTVLTGRLRSLAEVRPGLPRSLARIVDRALSRRPERRQSSATELVDQLEAVRLELSLPGTAPAVLMTLVTAAFAGDAGDDMTGVRALLEEHAGREVAAGGEHAQWRLLFERPWNAVSWALACQARLPRPSRLGIHLAEAFHRPAGEPRIDRAALDLSGRLAALAGERQTLLTRGAFDLARQAADGRPSWRAHGTFRFEGSGEPVEVFEVGEAGVAPLAPPAGGPGARPVAPGDAILGWRPAAGETIDARPGWRLVEKLGEGGYGEVWLAVHEETGERRAFKFCLEVRRLRALQREITLFRLLKNELGERDDITRILDWNFDSEPYFIESEHSEEGDLAHWAENRGGLGEVPLATRLAIVGQIAEALAAAHSVGVLHKDVKPSNVLIRGGATGGPRAQLADFGIGLATEPSRLEVAGLSMAATEGGSSGTPLYRAPELLEGRAATLQADVYSLGVLLYQMVVGDLRRALGPGWERDVDDELLREDIAWAVDKSPRRRLSNAMRLAERLEALGDRRHRRDVERREREAALQAQAELKRSHRRRKLAAAAIIVLAVFAAALAWQVRRADREAARAAREAETSRQVADFLVQVFEVSDPASGSGREITAREILDRGSSRLGSELLDQPEVRSRLSRTLGRVYRGLGLYPEAAPLIEDALASQRELWSEDHPEIARSLDELSELERLRGNYDRAEALGREALEIRRRLLGDEHLDVAGSLGNLAQVHTDRGDYRAAEPLHLEALEIRRRLLGNEHPSVARSLNRLAANHAQHGDHFAAERLYLEALGMHRRLSGGEHPDKALILGNLAATHYRKGDYVAAEPFAREAAELYRRLHGGEHPDLARSLDILAQVLQMQGDLEAAEPLYREAVEMKRRLLDGDHPSLANSLNNLGWLLKSKGRLAESEKLYLEALEMRRRAYGDEHAVVGNSLSHLGWLLRAMGDPARAERYFRDVLALNRRLYGDGHRKVAVAMDHLADLLIETGNQEEARDLCLEALEILPRSLPPDHWQIAATRNKLGAALAGLGKDAEAEDLLLESYRTLKKKRGEGTQITRTARLRLASFYQSRGEAEKAAAYRDDS